MAESRIRDDNYFQVSGWMINKLHLKGISLKVYAIIYGFSQDGDSEFTGSLQYLCDFTGGTSKPTIIKALKELTEKQYIIRREEIISGVQFNRYKANLPLLKNLNGGSKETLLGGSKISLMGGSKETLPNNKVINNKPLDNKRIYQLIADMYNEICISLPSVKSLSDNRKKAIKARLNKYSVEQFKELFTKTEASEFLTGSNNRNWAASFDWLIKDANFAKVLDGNYDNKAAKNKGSETSYDIDEYEKRTIEMWNNKPDPVTAADNPEIAARAEALRKQFTE